MESIASNTLNGDSVTVAINAINLSEDMSTLSSKNDEVLLLIYSFDDTLKLAAPLLAEYFVLDSINRKNEMTLNLTEDKNNFLVLLAELDTERPYETVEKLIRKNFRSIMECINKRDLVALEKYVDDDDIIGFREISRTEAVKGISFVFQGRYKLDKYHYKIDLKKKPSP